ncbi:MAG: DUF3858 domain-containing protein [bacterium]
MATGVNAVYFRSVLEDPECQTKSSKEVFCSTYPGAKLIKAKYSPLPALESDVKIEFTPESPQLRRRMARVNCFPRNDQRFSVARRQAKRTQDPDHPRPIYVRNGVELPNSEDTKLHEIPQDVALNSRFGALNITYKQKGDTIEASVIYRLDTQRVAVEDYGEFRKFVAEMNDALNETITLGGQP